MRIFLSTLLLTAVALFATSCISEREFDRIGERTEADVILRLRAPEGFAGQGTRAALGFPDENRLNDVTVLVFDNQQVLTAIRPGRSIGYTPGLNPPGSPTISGTGVFEVALPASASDADRFRLVVLANASDIVTARVGTTLGGIYNAVMADLWQAINGKMLQTAPIGIPMWGEAYDVRVYADVEIPTVPLTRAVARIDVGVGTVSGDTGATGFTWSGNNANGEAVPFVLESVYIMRPNNHFALVPAGGELPTPVTGNPTVPAGAAPFTIDQSANLFGFAATGGNVHRQIYMPEANVRTPMGGEQVANDDIRSGDLNHTNRMAVVVGGRFDGSATTTYYRIDFIQNQGDRRSLINVLRNHLYTINIMGVSAPGERTPEEAYRALAVNMEVEINEWEMVTEEIFFDGLNWIRLHHTRNESLSRHAVLYRTANTEDRLYFETNIPLNEWNLAGMTLAQNYFFGQAVTCQCPPIVCDCNLYEYECVCPPYCELHFDVEGQTLIQTVQNDRFRVRLIQTGTTPCPQTGRTIHLGFFEFTSRVAYTGLPEQILHVEAGREVIVGGRRIINFPITIEQRGDDPSDWNYGGSDDIEVGEDD